MDPAPEPTAPPPELRRAAVLRTARWTLYAIVGVMAIVPVGAIVYRLIGDDAQPLGEEERLFREVDERFDAQIPRDPSPEPPAPREPASLTLLVFEDDGSGGLRLFVRPPLVRGTFTLSAGVRDEAFIAWLRRWQDEHPLEALPLVAERDGAALPAEPAASKPLRDALAALGIRTSLLGDPAEGN